MKKWIIVILIIFIGIVGYNYIYQDHRDIGEEEPAYVMSADALNNEFVSDMDSSEKKYLNKTIALSGEVTESNHKDLTLNSKVFCQLSDSLAIPPEKNSNIKLKGRVIGYDELLEQVKLDQCIIIK